MTIERRTGLSEDTFCHGTQCRLVTFPGWYPKLPSTMHEESRDRDLRNCPGFGKLRNSVAPRWFRVIGHALRVAPSLTSMSPRLQLKFVIATATFQSKFLPQRRYR